MDWVNEAEAAKDSILAYFSKFEMPGYMEPEDVYQDVCEWILTKGWDDRSEGWVENVFRTKGAWVISNAVRAEKGESSHGPRRFTTLEQDAEIASELSDPEGFVGAGRDVRKALREAVDTPKARRVVWLRFMEGWTTKEIAEKEGFETTQGVRDSLRRSMAKMREYLDG